MMKKALLFVAITAMLSVGLMFTSCSSDSTPSGVVKNYYSSLKSGNVEKAASYMNVSEERAAELAKEYKNALDRDNANAELMKKGNVSIESETINGDEADVVVSIELDGMEVGQPMHLVKVDGNWKIQD